MISDQKKTGINGGWFYVLAILLYGLFYWINSPLDYQACELCDGHQYAKLYVFFETGIVSPIHFPFYNRLLVPWLASLLPGTQMHVHFDVVNFVFFVLSLWSIRKLWLALALRGWMQVLGFSWLLLHWVGIIRYNLHDNLTVDVPLYFFQSLALWFFIQKKYNWFFLLVPVALLQKESFLAVMLVFIVLHFVFEYKNQPWQQGQYLVAATLVGVVIQKFILLQQPDQIDQRSSFDAILYHGYWALKDPTRFVRWLAAVGSAYGVLPFVGLFRYRWCRLLDQRYATLVVLSLMYGAFGLVAGEDMTRILFLGLPFILTFSLLALQEVHTKTQVIAMILSVAALRLFPIPIDVAWAVDYASMSYVWQWFAYYGIAVGLLFVIYKNQTQLKRH
ncbi:hypothetical protein N7E81_05075 [Reichenbachiella carrageenanivorans]|uniref:Uncharacterized protein n=1 Tax=Reichenbachiella carrageenanivorans TaxID=2979869 RepID=A0ABY6D2U1_9BACT|nr:hypothetical protein [Reichenbachiella carrageenanivorans]UXX80471.1 hypothetical protein N7E81_05075 [Reichenbachiella carrageenanivorans]